jgi:alkanesulfonate monooxygenase SsuD/methylene tetrahydromethanopterin reductase-like flavin-dependent oxidoreductase (luciferase family)
MRNHGTDPATRGRLMDERIRAVIALWTQDEAEFHGEFVDFEPSFCWPKPVQRPHPPIYVGGGSERTFARVAEYGAAWMPSGVRPRDLGAQIDRMRATAGDRPAVVVYAALFSLPTTPEDETLRTLDELAEAAAPYR